MGLESEERDRPSGAHEPHVGVAGIVSVRPRFGLGRRYEVAVTDAAWSEVQLPVGAYQAMAPDVPLVLRQAVGSAAAEAATEPFSAPSILVGGAAYFVVDDVFGGNLAARSTDGSGTLVVQRVDAT